MSRQKQNMSLKQLARNEPQGLPNLTEPNDPDNHTPLKGLSANNIMITQCYISRNTCINVITEGQIFPTTGQPQSMQITRNFWILLMKGICSKAICWLDRGYQT